MFDEPWADRHDRRLRTKLTRLLPAGETLREVAIVFTGPEPNLVGLTEDLMGQAVFGGLVNRRKYFTLALTGRRLLVIANIGEHSPDKLVTFLTDTAATVEDISTVDGTTWISVGGRRYWYWPTWSRQVIAIHTLCHGPAEP